MRFELRDLAGSLMPTSRVAGCGWRPIPSKSIRVTMKDGRAGITGVQMCGSIWTCPVCAVKIAVQRSEELAASIDTWEAIGGTCGLLTLTIRHSRHDELDANLDGLTEAMREFWSGGWARSFRRRWGLVGQVRNLEATFGFENGWHPHAHVVLFLGEYDGGAMYRRFKEHDALELELEVKERWRVVAARHGFDVTLERGATLELQDPDRPRFEVVREYDSALAEYLTKIVPLEELWGLGDELTWSHIKQTRGKRYTPWMLLAASLNDHRLEDPESRAPALFQAYAAAYEGRRQLVWSPGLKARLLPDRLDQSDDELAHSHDESAVEVAVIPRGAWLVIRSNGQIPELLEAAELDGSEGVRAFLSTIRRRPLGFRPRSSRHRRA